MELFLALFDQHGVEGAIAITGHLQLDIPVNRAHRLAAFAIAGVAGVLAIARVLGIAQVSGHLSIKGSFGDTLSQLFEQAALAEDVFRTGAAGQ